jgi:peptidoglycan/xylan/chitin deacetylase (PgdA/CDA1 family)
MSDVLVLCYHAVSPSWDADLAVTPEMFERQIGSLLSRGWTAVTFQEAALAPPASRTLAITFDDAFASVREHAAPILDALSAPATVFAPTAYPSAGTLSWDGIDHWQNTSHSAELEAMSWNDLGELAGRGWEIGSHTRSHPRLTQLDDAALKDELEGSYEDCAARLGQPSRTIAYPYGDVDARVAESASRAGYLAGASLSSRLERLGPHRYPRVGIYHGDDRRRFRLKVSRTMRALRASRLWARAA